jgi:hypothetical protein
VRVVFDTNIVISAFVIPGGNAEEAYLHAVRRTFEFFTSLAILTETANILRTTFEWSDEKVGRPSGSHESTFSATYRREPLKGSWQGPTLRKIFDISDISIIMLLVTSQKE